MITSLITISGQICSASSMASVPLNAKTASNPARERMSLRLWAINCSSSTTRMRCFRDVSRTSVAASGEVSATGSLPENRCSVGTIIRQRSLLQCSSGRTSALLAGTRYTQRELDAEHRAPAIPGSKRNPATMLFDQTLGYPKSKTGSHVGLGGKERVENACLQVSWNATSAIGKCYLHARLTVPEHSLAMYLDDTMVGRGINGVRNEIRKDLTHFALVCFDLQARLDIEVDSE